MVSYGSGRGWPAVVADVLALPLRDGVFDAAVAGFLLNHLPPAAALAELTRVVSPGGVVLASTWGDSVTR
jgi:ubiquinone/menaquinone biosynthesis C-methylase UbiE